MNPLKSEMKEEFIKLNGSQPTAEKYV